MIAAFVADISRHVEAAGERLFNLAKELRYLVEIRGGYGSNRIGEEQALFIERVESARFAGEQSSGFAQPQSAATPEAESTGSILIHSGDSL